MVIAMITGCSQPPRTGPERAGCALSGFLSPYDHTIVIIVVIFLNPILGGRVEETAGPWISFILYRGTSSLNFPSKPSPQVPGHQEVKPARELARPPACQLEGAVVAGLASPPHPRFWATGFALRRPAPGLPGQDDRHMQTYSWLGGQVPWEPRLPCRHPGWHPRATFFGRESGGGVFGELLARACTMPVLHGHLRSSPPSEHTPGGRAQDQPISREKAGLTDLHSHSGCAGVRV